MILSVVKQSSVPLFECASFRTTELCFTCFLAKVSALAMWEHLLMARAVTGSTTSPPSALSNIHITILTTLPVFSVSAAKCAVPE